MGRTPSSRAASIKRLAPPKEALPPGRWYNRLRIGRDSSSVFHLLWRAIGRLHRRNHPVTTRKLTTQTFQQMRPGGRGGFAKTRHPTVSCFTGLEFICPVPPRAHTKIHVDEHQRPHTWQRRFLDDDSIQSVPHSGLQHSVFLHVTKVHNNMPPMRAGRHTTEQQQQPYHTVRTTRQARHIWNVHRHDPRNGAQQGQFHGSTKD